MWDVEPQANDPAMDWLDQLFEETELVRRVDETLSRHVSDSLHENRIAAHLLCTLSQAGIWPREEMLRQVPISVNHLEEALFFRLCTNPSLIAAIREEIDKLQKLLAE